ncbi:prestin-like [Liolophura sinensis]|uniref:prestin-like n=1 Tax=Liolophura sinensis TaxID=3198878 RepID=UPI00315953F4
MLEDRDLSMSRQLLNSSDANQVIVRRPVYSQVKFDEGYESRSRSGNKTSIKDKIKGLCSCRCSAQCCKNVLKRNFPFIHLLKGYSIKDDLPNDIMSGLTVGIMHIPQGMAYGLLAALPPVYGLYVSFFPVFMYFLFGTSKHISIGTFAVVSLMVGAVAEKGFAKYGSPVTNLTMTPDSNGTETLSNHGTADPIKLGFATMVTFCAGSMQLLMGVCKLGFVTTYLSDPLVRGFTTAAACHVFTSQITHVFGNYGNEARPSGVLKLIKMYEIFFRHITKTNIVTLITAVASMLSLYLVKECINVRFKSKMRMPVPIELIVVVLVTVISHFAELHENYDVAIVQEIPKGVPLPQAPKFEYLTEVITDSFAIAIVGFAVSVSMAKIICKNHDYEIDSNQELIAYGMGNLFGSFFNCFTSSASLSRSLIQDNVGGKTQIAGLVSCGLLLIVLVAVGPLFRALPKCILAAIVIVNLKGMFKQAFQLPSLWRVSRFDFAIWVVTWSATVLLDVDMGLGVGVLFSFLTVLWRTQLAYACVLGRVPHTDLYRDVKVYKAAQEIPGIKIFRFESSLYYANIDRFRDRLYELSSVNPSVLKRKKKKALNLIEKEAKKLKKEQAKNGIKMDESPNDITVEMTEEQGSAEISEDTTVHPTIPQAPISHIIIDCSSMAYLDTMGIQALSQVISEYKNVDVTVFLAQCKAGVREMMDTTEFYKNVDKGCLFLTLHDAVLQALQTRRSLLNEIILDSPNSKSGDIHVTEDAVDDKLDSSQQNGPKKSSGYINEAPDQQVAHCNTEI